MNKKTELSGKKVLIATVAADGHFNPLTGLAKHLAGLGCEVRWYTSRIFQNRLAGLGIHHYPFLKAKDINPTTLNEIFPERESLNDAGEKANFDMINIFIKPGPDMFEDILDIQDDFSFDVLIADNMFPAIPYASAKLDVPVLAIGIVPLSERSKELGPYGPGFYPPTNDNERQKIAELNRFFQNVVYKAGTDCLSGLLGEHGINHQHTDFFDILTKAPDLYLQIGTPSFEYDRRDLGKNIRFIGSLLPYMAPSMEKPWHDERIMSYKKIVLVTQGTVEKDITKLIIPTLEAFKETDVLVIATTGGSQTIKLKEQYPFENIIIEDFIPFDQVMPYANVYLTNGGYGGVLFGIKNGLPMVAAGLYEGKAEVCARIGYFNYGIDMKTE
jgi:UDP:flavonoid glycosyltransferase YjiC (YdhE family)